MTLEEAQEKLRTITSAIQMLAADNARLCDIALKADALAEQIDRLLGTGSYSMAKIRRALEAYKITRQGT